jgi:hypothetical protein
MQPDLTLAKLSLVESADYVVRQAGFFDLPAIFSFSAAFEALGFSRDQR